MAESGTRGTATTLSYSLALVITAILVSGLLVTGAGFVEDQRESVTRNELDVVGQQLAAGVGDANRLVGAAATDTAEVRVRVALPDRVTGASYTVRVDERSAPGSDPGTYHLVLSSDAVNVTERVVVRSSTELLERSVKGGSVVVRYVDDDADPEKELVLGSGPLVVSWVPSLGDGVAVAADTIGMTEQLNL